MIWKKVYQLKNKAFGLEEQANLLNIQVYENKRLFYVYRKKASKCYAEFVRLKAEANRVKFEAKITSECCWRLSEENK